MIGRIAIIGGGIAGLALSIDLKKRGFDVVVIEKGVYPRHKVCGEYISMESARYLKSLCPPLEQMKLPFINNLLVSSTGNNQLVIPLDLGGFGISRYLLEDMLYQEALVRGVSFRLHTKAETINYDESGNQFIISTGKEKINACLVCNASGRKSNFEKKSMNPLAIKTNYVGVKYHVRIKRDPGLIEIHNFSGGYCGISNIENSMSCLCYIVNSNMLKQAGNSIFKLEKFVLCKNPRLQEIFKNAEFITTTPVTVSGINFLIKNPGSSGVYQLGDAAGSIAPITGNGMSMGLRSASVLAAHIFNLRELSFPFIELTGTYADFWKKEFSSRIVLSRYLQKLSEFPALTRASIKVLNAFPALAKKIVGHTHGEPF